MGWSTALVWSALSAATAASGSADVEPSEASSDRGLAVPTSGYLEPCVGCPRSTGPFVRMSAVGLVGYYGDPFYADANRRAISDLAFGTGITFGYQTDPVLSFAIRGEVLFGGVDTEVLEGFHLFDRNDSMRASVGVSTRVTLGEAPGWQPTLGLEATFFRQWVWWASEEGRAVPVVSPYTGQVGFISVPDLEARTTHNGWGVGPSIGLMKQLDPDGWGPSFFVEVLGQYQRWTPDDVDFNSAPDRVTFESARTALRNLQTEAEAWSATVRVGLQFGP